MLQSAARAVLLSRRGSLTDQVVRLDRVEKLAPPPAPPPSPKNTVEAAAPRPELEYFNGLGGFADGGREYVTILGAGQSTPAPWLNVISNPSFGFQVSESGSGYTWSGNSRENQLTPWSNDPVSDPVSEAIYVRDEDSGELWGPTAQPIRCDESTYVARHGADARRPVRVILDAAVQRDAADPGHIQDRRWDGHAQRRRPRSSRGARRAEE